MKLVKTGFYISFFYIFFFLFLLSVTALPFCDEVEMKLDFNKLKLDLTQAEEEWLDNHRKITVSGPLNFPPFHFFSEEGEAFGIASDYVRFITDTLGVEIESYKNFPGLKF